MMPLLPAGGWAPRAAAATVLAALLLAAAAGAPPDDLPPLLFVSRQMPRGPGAGQVPGLGPHGSTLAVGGRLLLRERGGAVRELLPRGALFDVQDPDVSWDAKRVVFSGLASPTGHWRLYTLDFAGGALVPLTGAGADTAAADDIDPCWNGDEVVFVRRVASERSSYDSSAAGALYACRRGAPARRLLAEVNGVLDPVVDTRRGTLVYARWWFNPWLPDGGGGLVRDASAAVTRDTVNAWQVVEAAPQAGRDGARHWRVPLAGVRLRAGGVTGRRAGMGLQPAPLGDGIVATYAANTGLAPSPGATGVHLMGHAPSAGARLTGAAIGDDLASPYSEGSGLAAPGACAPAVLPDGRVIVSFAAGPRGDFGLWLVKPDGARRLVLDLPGTLELDAAPLVVRQATPLDLSASPPPANTFRFLDTDVFAGRGAPRRASGLRLRFLAWDLGAAGPRVVAEVPVPRSGRVDPVVARSGALFEQLVDERGLIVMSAHGPAQVRGFNTPAAGSVQRCSGCHLGHSAAR